MQMSPNQSLSIRKMGGNQKSENKNSESSSKKSFNKVQWRKNKYSHKAKLEQFEERRRKAIVHNYYKTLKKEGQLPIKTEGQEEPVQHKRAPSAHQLAQQDLERRAQEKEERKKEKERQKAEKEEAIKKYRKEKLRKYIQLKKKTRKGQPVMAGRMELLLEKIQRTVGSDRQ